MSRHFGVETCEGLTSRDRKKIIMHAQKEIHKNTEWDGYESANIINPETSEEHLGFKSFSIMLGKTTFADENYKEFKRQLNAAESELINYPAYSGTAIHYFKVLDEKFYEKPSKVSETIR